ncbi:unnamed protein product [Urochloa decumbens]|uniref:FBD domain-containing protein n=1 Tax=Urochloa decumbens TaxID=240449 RepID=A0ABC8X1W3_9POAL
MGLLGLQRLMSLQGDRQQYRRQIVARNGSIASVNKRKGSPCLHDGDGDSQAGKILGCSIPDLPEDIWRHIHSLMPLRDAARAACLSHAFLYSWRCHPNLIFNEDELSSKTHANKQNFSDTIDRILTNHSGIGVKILNFELDGIAYHNLDKWLQVAVTPGIEELTVMLCRFKIQYKFPCSLLSEGIRNSIKFLELGFCIFHPTAELGTLRSLTCLCLFHVHIEGNELECLLSNSPVLEQLDLSHCDKIICLKIPCVLQQLNYLKAVACRRLRVIENQAPNLSSLYFSGNVIGETSQVKNLSINRSKGVCYARVELPSIMPNLETLGIRSGDEGVNTPMLPTKFMYLKHINIFVKSGTTSPPYDYLSLVSFLDASPSLETLILDVSQERMEHHESVLGHSSHWRQMDEHHSSLKSVKIIGFSSAKSLVELTCYILKIAISLESLTLDTLYGFRCSDENYNRCLCMGKRIISEAPRAVTAVRMYIEDKVPSGVKLTVVEPCSRCHAVPVGA